MQISRRHTLACTTIPLPLAFYVAYAESAGFDGPSEPVAPCFIPFPQTASPRMDSERSRDGKASGERAVYLVLREGNSWRDVFRLTAGQVTTLGRAPTNRIVIRDDVCSRNHCEIFQTGRGWTLRDLGSRNGTVVNGKRIIADWELDDGDIVQIGKSQLGFTRDISKPLPQFGNEESTVGDTATDIATIDPNSLPSGGESSEEIDVVPAPEPDILHRTRETRYNAVDGAPDRENMVEDLRKLYRLAIEMGACKDCKSLCDTVLTGLLDAVSADIGAILLLPVKATTDPSPERLQVVAYRLKSNQPYERVSDTLSRIALVNREAILANVCDDHRLSSRDSLGLMQARTVICAPIRRQDAIHGLVHLYSTNTDNPLDRSDLEFTLAVADQLALALDNLQERESLQVGLARIEDENLTLRRQLELGDRIVGDSPSVQKLRQTISRVAPNSATALIRGESGVGKELVARAIHNGSDRAEGPFVCMNCAALSESLLESELFGHEKGSFTGAVGRKIGKFEQAHRGTLFLDEVGEMSQSIQAKFLRVLEGHPFERVGGGTPVLVDVRVVAATNRDLEHAVSDSTFRRDLYFRLHVLELVVDPLRKRKSDIPLLANHFLERFARKTNKPPKRLSRESLDSLLAYEWPGNIRELQNVVERACILSNDGEWIDEQDIQLSTLGHQPQESGYREVTLDLLEQQHILATLEKTHWNKSRAAQILGIERSTLDRKLKRYNVDRPGEE
jgi:Nif-specific regulatory protein